MATTSDGIGFQDARAPEGMRLYAIGDVHGCRDLLAAMHRRIFAEIDRDKPEDWRVIHLGDYVDRGPDAKGVLDLIIEAQERDRRVLALGGNHDVGLLDFIGNPDAYGLFAQYGGEDTARSYGVDLRFGDPRSMMEGHAKLVDAIPRAHLDFLLRLEFQAAFGDVFFCHAGIRPGRPLDGQTREDLIWIRDVFLDWEGLHPKLVVHGHTPVPAPDIRPNRVNLDTGAFRTGRLSALAIEGADKRLIEIS
ncbi:MAG: serine/threonine protein phosphatase [Methylobacterium mesophilicum]|nr:serine/threonine protein phosphatase [Methylobacterium mesophilicum]